MSLATASDLEEKVGIFSPRHCARRMSAFWMGVDENVFLARAQSFGTTHL